MLIGFLKDLESKHTAPNVGEAFTDVASQLGLNICVRLDIGEEVFIGCEQASLEGTLLSKFVHSHEKIISVGIRTIVCEENIVVLVKDMPLNDENKYGRFKDHLAVLIDFSQKHLSNLKNEEYVQQQRKQLLQQVIRIAEEQISLTSEKVLNHAMASQRIMEGMVESLEEMLFGLGLDEDQEKKLMSLADNTSNTLEQALSDAQTLSSDLGGILEKLYELQNTGSFS